MNQTVNRYIFFIVALLILSIEGICQQQVENSMSQYFRNKLLWNPAFTGQNGDHIFLLRNNSWVGFEGAPTVTGVSGAYNFGENSAFGANLMSYKAGVLTKNYGVLNYSYKIQFEENNLLRIGVALTFSGSHINSSLPATDYMIDPLIAQNFDRRLKFDGNLGVVYQRENIEASLVAYRMGDNLKGGENTANQAIGLVGVSYLFEFGEDGSTKMRPLILYRKYKATNSIFDLGVEFEFNKMINLSTFYQTSGNIRFGAGILKEDLGELNLFYSNNTKVTNMGSQQYELGIGIYLNRKQ